MDISPQWSVAPAGQAPVRCPNCDERLAEWGVRIESRITRGRYRCDRCLLPVTSKDLESGDSLDVVSECAALLDREAAQDAVWYHATIRKDWFNAVRAADDDQRVLVHIGTRQAAIRRAKMRSEAITAIKNDWTLYALRLVEPEALTERVMMDENDYCPPFVADLRRPGVAERYGRATRYVNAYEAIGSISVLADPRLLRVEAVTRLTAADLDMN